MTTLLQAPAGSSPPAREASALRGHARLAARVGRTGLAPFLTAHGVQVVELAGGVAAAGYVPCGGWAVTPGDVIAPAELAEAALGEYLHALAARRLRPAFLAVADPRPYLGRGFALSEVADEAVLDLGHFALAGPARANVRHSVASARRAGLRVSSYEPGLDGQLAEISREWLCTKRGGELGFTLSRYADVPAQLEAGASELWAVLDRAGNVQAWCTWRPYRNGAARVLDVMRRRPGAPNPAMDYLIAATLEHYRAAGCSLASLASVPREHRAMAERVYPCRSLRAYKQKFDPRWETRWLAVPSAWQRPLALAAICRAYCPGGLRRALRRNR